MENKLLFLILLILLFFALIGLVIQSIRIKKQSKKKFYAGEIWFDKDDMDQWISGFKFYPDDIQEFLNHDEIVFYVKSSDPIMKK